MMFYLSVITRLVTFIIQQICCVLFCYVMLCYGQLFRSDGAKLSDKRITGRLLRLLP